MHATYDPAVDAMYVYLVGKPRKGQVITREARPGISLDSVGDAPIGIEILDASARFTSVQMKAIRGFPTGEVELTMAEAVEESGLAAQTLRAQIANGRLPATKRGRDWSIGRTALMNYMESRDTRGRPAAAKRARRKKSAA